jgi:hypothetical protein
VGQADGALRGEEEVVICKWCAWMLLTSKRDSFRPGRNLRSIRSE